MQCIENDTPLLHSQGGGGGGGGGVGIRFLQYSLLLPEL